MVIASSQHTELLLAFHNMLCGKHGDEKLNVFHEEKKCKSWLRDQRDDATRGCQQAQWGRGMSAISRLVQCHISMTVFALRLLCLRWWMDRMRTQQVEVLTVAVILLLSCLLQSSGWLSALQRSESSLGRVYDSQCVCARVCVLWPVYFSARAFKGDSMRLTLPFYCLGSLNGGLT